MTRLADWTYRLDKLIRERDATRFCWGTHDCCMFAADAIQAVTGEDPAEDLRGAYVTEDQARSVLAQLGGPEGICDAVLGERISVTEAMPGDILLIEFSVGGHKDRALGVCAGHVTVAPGLTRLVRVRTIDGVAAWRVG